MLFYFSHYKIDIGKQLKYIHNKKNLLQITYHVSLFPIFVKLSQNAKGYFD
jgi:hypothetical protein